MRKRRSAGRSTASGATASRSTCSSSTIAAAGRWPNSSARWATASKSSGRTRISASPGQRISGSQRLLAKPYEFVAMMDADDISHPERLAKQVAFLKSASGRRAGRRLGPIFRRKYPRGRLSLPAALRIPGNPRGAVSQQLHHASDLDDANAGAARLRPLLDLLSGGGRLRAAAPDVEAVRPREPARISARIQPFHVRHIDEESASPAVRPAAHPGESISIPRQAKAWLGVARTLAMFAVPRGVVSAYRADQNLRVQPS